MNSVRTSLLLAASIAITMAIGALLGGKTGMAVAFGLSALLAANCYWRGDVIALRAHSARLPQGQQEHAAVAVVNAMARRGHLPTPQVWFTDAPQPNAFTCGRSPVHSSIVLSTGLLDTLKRHELAGVIAHELAHIRNRDTLLLTVSSAIAGAIAGFGALLALAGLMTARRGGFFAAILGIFTMMGAGVIHLAIGRSREYVADYDGARLCGHPEWIIAALRTLARETRAIPNVSAQANPATIPLFTVNPVPDEWIIRLFSTHPSIESRIKRLEDLLRRPRP